jgi:hypothetical protein
MTTKTFNSLFSNLFDGVTASTVLDSYGLPSESVASVTDCIYNEFIPYIDQYNYKPSPFTSVSGRGYDGTINPENVSVRRAVASTINAVIPNPYNHSLKDAKTVLSQAYNSGVGIVSRNFGDGRSVLKGYIARHINELMKLTNQTAVTQDALRAIDAQNNLFLDALPEYVKNYITTEQTSGFMTKRTIAEINYYSDPVDKTKRVHTRGIYEIIKATSRILRSMLVSNTARNTTAVDNSAIADLTRRVVELESKAGIVHSAGGRNIREKKTRKIKRACKRRAKKRTMCHK